MNKKSFLFSLIGLVPIAICPVFFTTSCSNVVQQLDNGKISSSPKISISNEKINDGTTKSISPDITYFTLQTQGNRKQIIDQVNDWISASGQGDNLLDTNGDLTKNKDISNLDLLPKLANGKISSDSSNYHLVLTFHEGSKFRSDKLNPFFYTKDNPVSPVFILDIDVSWELSGTNHVVPIDSELAIGYRFMNVYYKSNTDLDTAQTYPISSYGVQFIDNVSHGVMCINQNEEQLDLQLSSDSVIPTSDGTSYFSSSSLDDSHKIYNVTANEDVVEKEYKASSQYDLWYLIFMVDVSGSTKSYKLPFSTNYFDRSQEYGSHGYKDDDTDIPYNEVDYMWNTISYSNNKIATSGSYFNANFSLDDQNEWNYANTNYWYNHNLSTYFIARNIFFNYFYFANMLLQNGINVSKIEMTYSSISLSKTSNLSHNIDKGDIHGFYDNYLLKGQLIYGINLKNVHIVISTDEEPDYWDITLNTKNKLQIKTIYAGNCSDLIDTTNCYYRQYDENGSIAINHLYDNVGTMPLIVLGGLNSTNKIDNGNNIVYSTETNFPNGSIFNNSTLNCLPLLLCPFDCNHNYDYSETTYYNFPKMDEANGIFNPLI